MENPLSNTQETPIPNPERLVKIKIVLFCVLFGAMFGFISFWAFFHNDITALWGALAGLLIGLQSGYFLTRVKDKKPVQNLAEVVLKTTTSIWFKVAVDISCWLMIAILVLAAAQYMTGVMNCMNVIKCPCLQNITPIGMENISNLTITVP